MIAHNLIIRKINIPNFTIYQIDSMSQFQIDELAKLLTLKSNNRENVKNILRYMGKLDEIIEHPDIKPQILNTILELKVMSSNLNEVINIFKNNKFLRRFIYNNMEKIISNNIVIKKPGKLDKEMAQYLADYIFWFMKLNENILAKEAIKIALKYEYDELEYDEYGEYYKLPKTIGYLTYNVLTSLDADLIIKYFDLFDYINSVYESKNYDVIIHDNSIVNALVNAERELLNKQKKYLPSIFKAALTRDKIEILKPIYHLWWFESVKKKDLFLEQMEPLIKEFEEKYPNEIFYYI